MMMPGIRPCRHLLCDNPVEHPEHCGPCQGCLDLRRSACVRADGGKKRTYATAKEARKQARLTRQASGGSGDERKAIRAYRCPDCHLFHVGHEQRR